ncbi:MAG: hypothetical protein CME31_23345 [Gimesia sp.]|nr:hypothetical protein [Gimesia sp.]|tara:strand:+ start:1765 stop:2133 length:369 start_codon:yes stop_codon:yes gene_type:complete
MIRGLKTNRLEGISSPITDVMSVKAESLKEDNKMKDTQIFNKIKSVFPKAVFIESDEYLIEDNMVQVDKKTHICWMPQDKSLTSDIYQADLLFTVTRKVEDSNFCSMHSNLKNVIAKIKKYK